VSTVVPSQGAWHTLLVHLVINGASGQIQTWFDGALVPQLTANTATFGTNGVGTLHIGDNAGGKAFVVRFDAVRADTASFTP
jgi:hypothetical protein